MTTVIPIGRTTPRVLVRIALISAFAAGLAHAQTVVSNPTTTTLWAGTQDLVTFGQGSITRPHTGVILSGTAISTITGLPVRHLWYGDEATGLCRIDPEVDAIVPEVAGIGGHVTATATCIATIQKIEFVPGQLSFDASTNTLYAPDIVTPNTGLIRMHYIPSGDNGHGAIDPLRVESLMGTGTGTVGCQTPSDPINGTIPSQPVSTALGPDGNLYIGFRLDGAVIRILSPATLNPSLASDCQNKIQVPLFSADERVSVGHTFGLGWISHTLFGADNIAPWVLDNADQCLTAINGNKRCGPAGGMAPGPVEILAANVPMPLGGASSDAQYPNFAGNTMYFGTATSVAKVNNIVSGTNFNVQFNYGSPASGFCFITGMTPDPLNLANETLYVGNDCTLGGTNGAGAIWQITPGTQASGPPLPPNTVTAVGGNGQATVNWLPTPNNQPITSYLVRTVLAGGAATTVPDVTVVAGANGVAPTTATVTGLTNGLSYQFEVEACNSVGCSSFSALSNVVILIAPGAPASVVALAGDASASVAWAPATDPAGTPPVTSSTISAFDTLAPTVVAATSTVAAPATGGVVGGLINGDTYTFTVHATNAVGNSPESAPSLPVTPVAPTATDMAITMSAPASANAGTVLTFTMIVNNFGPANATQVSLADTLPAPLASFTTSQGTCTGAVGATSLSCSLGPLNAGQSAKVTVSVTLPLSATGSVTNTATVAATGLTDPAPANNTASATVPVLAAVSTDIQVGGSAQNGGPAVGSADTFTWQIKNNQGTVNAPGVVFTSAMPASFRFGSVTPSQGTCSAPAAGSLGGTISCSLGTINGGNTAIVTVNFTPTLAGTFSTTGSATFAGTDTNPANNSFTVTIGPK